MPGLSINIKNYEQAYGMWLVRDLVVEIMAESVKKGSDYSKGKMPPFEHYEALYVNQVDAENAQFNDHVAWARSKVSSSLASGRIF